jgi:2-C-methyl-D-erythritol 4-phosphate cytidylyltransferase
MHYWIVMPAAGVGRRFGSAKQYALLGNRTVLQTALQVFLDDPQCRGGSVLLASADAQRAQLAAQLPERIALVDGGPERAHSVCNGLRSLEARAGDDDWVLVHDAVRPALSAADLQRLLRHGAADPVGALLATPVPDTVKRAHNGAAGADRAAAGAGVGAGALLRRSEATVPRDSLWLAQTPQMFRLSVLRSALERALAQGRIPTDEAQAMEWQGHAALLVQAQDSNLKITTAADLALLQAVLQHRAQSGGAGAAAGLVHDATAHGTR